MSMDKEKAAPVGHIPSGLFVVTTLNEKGEKVGYLASWVQQLSFNPLRIGLAINSDRPGFDQINEGAQFAVNTVGKQEAPEKEKAGAI